MALCRRPYPYPLLSRPALFLIRGVFCELPAFEYVTPHRPPTTTTTTACTAARQIEPNDSLGVHLEHELVEERLVAKSLADHRVQLACAREKNVTSTDSMRKKALRQQRQQQH